MSSIDVPSYAADERAHGPSVNVSDNIHVLKGLICDRLIEPETILPSIWSTSQLISPLTQHNV